MRSIYSILILLVFFGKVNAQAPNWAMANSNGGFDYDWGQEIAYDSYGNMVVAGAFYSSTITFGSTVLTNPNAGKFTSFIVRYDVNGNVIWAKQPIPVGGTLYNRATGVSIDNFNNIYVTGTYYCTTLTFDTITLTKNNSAAAFYIVKYDPVGNIIWAITTAGVHGGAVAYPPQPYFEPSPLNKIAIDKISGDIYLAGTFDLPTMVVDSTVLINATINNGYNFNRDAFIIKFNSSGNFIWAKSIGGTHQDYVSDISVNNSAIFITGNFNSPSLNIGSTTLINLNPTTSWERYLPFAAKFDTSGNPLWAKQGDAVLTGLKSSRGKSVATDFTGNCYITGEFEGPSIVFDNHTLYNTDTVIGPSKIFVVKYNPAGVVIWSKTFANGSGSDRAMDIQTDGLTNVYVGGTFTDSVLINGQVITSSNKTFIAKFTSSGALYWVKTPDGGGGMFLIGLSINSLGNIFSTGSFNSNLYFGSDTLISNGQSDIFTAITLNCSPAFSPITAQGNTTFCQGDSVTLSALPGNISYQWYRRNFAIPGETSMNYTAKNSGNYRCQSQNASLCIDTSNVILVNVPCIPIGPNQSRPIQLSEFTNNDFKIFPNPGNGLFTVTSPPGQLEIFNLIGELIYSLEIINELTPIDISTFSEGTYIAKLRTKNFIFNSKFTLIH